MQKKRYTSTVMKKLKLIALSALFLLGCTSPVIQESEPVPYETKDTKLHALITSDTHYISESNGADAIISLIGHGDDFMDCLTSQVLAVHPDVFVITGDVTNNGRKEDVEQLSTHLKRITDAGISLILTTGNHDYDADAIQEFETYFFPLLSIDQRDTTSLSYTTIVNDTCFIAMDDGYESNGRIGSFTSETMNWLENVLKDAAQKQQKIIFLSHHSVLSTDTDEHHRYTITNPDLKDLLESYGVQLCFTGHQHTQRLLHQDSMYELLSSMPQTGSNLIGDLQIDGQDVAYHTTPIDFETYANDSLRDFLQVEQQSPFADTFSLLFPDMEIDEVKQEKIVRLFETFMVDAQDGTIARDYDKIKNDPLYDVMLEALQDTNYGPWMQALMDNPPLDASSLQFNWNQMMQN